MTPYLPDDCIYDILEYLQDFRDFRSILFNCMLVNRFWCRTAIPLLYANPFATCKKGIILTFTLCFSKEEILQLKNQMNNNFMININDEYKPLFDYPKYLKIYNYSSINFTILGWINSYKRKYKKFCSIFNQLILNHCINIDRFNIDLVKLDSFIEFNPELNIPISNLTKLNSLTLELAKLQAFKHEIGKEFLNNIIIHCLNLKKLEIFEITQPIVSRESLRTDTTEKICELIRKQNNLEKFISSHYLTNNILLSLKFQQHSLVSIEFSRIDFSNISFDNFIHLYNLNYLRFSNCFDMKQSKNDRYEILKSASFKLKNLKFGFNNWNENIEPTIIKYSGSSLQKLSMYENSITNSNIQNISMYCLNLLTLEISIFGNMNLIETSFFKNLENSKLRKLNIFIYNNTQNDPNDTHESLMKLANNLSINIKEISFWFTTYKPSFFIKIFLEKCHNYLEKISLEIKQMINVSVEEFLKAILNYIEKSNNSLKIFNIITTDRKRLNDEESRILDEIKVKGVKIVTNL